MASPLFASIQGVNEWHTFKFELKGYSEIKDIEHFYIICMIEGSKAAHDQRQPSLYDWV